MHNCCSGVQHSVVVYSQRCTFCNYLLICIFIMCLPSRLPVSSVGHGFCFVHFICPAPSTMPVKSWIVICGMNELIMNEHTCWEHICMPVWMKKGAYKEKKEWESNFIANRVMGLKLVTKGTIRMQKVQSTSVRQSRIRRASVFPCWLCSSLAVT